jgi:hypothetical protein
MVDKGWVGVDLDGTLAVYPHSFPEIGPPIPKMVDRVKQWLADGEDVRIFTARVAIVPTLRSDYGVADDAFASDQIEKIRIWSVEHFGVELPVTATKDFKMVRLYDDRCVQMVTNTGESVEEQYDALLQQIRDLVAAG